MQLLLISLFLMFKASKALKLSQCIAQLAEFIKEDQVRNAVMASYGHHAGYSIKRLEPFSVH